MRSISVCVLLLASSQRGWATLPVFGDVSASSEHFNRVLVLKERGITMGCSYSPLNYCPDDNITRAQASILIVRSLYSKGYQNSNGNAEGFATPSSSSFEDVKTYHDQFRWIQKMRDLQLTTSGCDGSNFCPEGTLTYAELAVFTVRDWQTDNPFIRRCVEPTLRTVAPTVTSLADIGPNRSP